MFFGVGLAFCTNKRTFCYPMRHFTSKIHCGISSNNAPPYAVATGNEDTLFPLDIEYFTRYAEFTV